MNTYFHDALGINMTMATSDSTRCRERELKRQRIDQDDAPLPLHYNDEGTLFDKARLMIGVHTPPIRPYNH